MRQWASSSKALSDYRRNFGLNHKPVCLCSVYAGKWCAFILGCYFCVCFLFHYILTRMCLEVSLRYMVEWGCIRKISFLEYMQTFLMCNNRTRVDLLGHQCYSSLGTVLQSILGTNEKCNVHTEPEYLRCPTTSLINTRNTFRAFCVYHSPLAWLSTTWYTSFPRRRILYEFYFALAVRGTIHLRTVPVAFVSGESLTKQNVPHRLSPKNSHPVPRWIYQKHHRNTLIRRHKAPLPFH